VSTVVSYVALKMVVRINNCCAIIVQLVTELYCLFLWCSSVLSEEVLTFMII